jgi:hypothetical protein
VQENVMMKRYKVILSILTGAILFISGIVDYLFLNEEHPLLAYIVLVICCITGLCWMIYGLDIED